MNKMTKNMIELYDIKINELKDLELRVKESKLKEMNLKRYDEKTGHYSNNLLKKERIIEIIRDELYELNKRKQNISDDFYLFQTNREKMFEMLISLENLRQELKDCIEKGQYFYGLDYLMNDELHKLLFKENVSSIDIEEDKVLRVLPINYLLKELEVIETSLISKCQKRLTYDIAYYNLSQRKNIKIERLD